MFVFFFFKHKTAYEMRISDWSSDVCSSDLALSNRAIHRALARGLVAGGVPLEAVQLIPTQDRAAVGAMLVASGLIDMIVPRGGKGLVARVQADARVPVLAHLDGLCHTYIH